MHTEVGTGKELPYCVQLDLHPSTTSDRLDSKILALDRRGVGPCFREG